MPVLLYASQTWSLTTKHKNTIEVCQRKVLRKILGISTRDRISNNHLQEWSILKNAAQQASRSKWTYSKASTHQMGAGNNYVGPLQSPEKQRQAKHQMGRLFHQTSGTTLIQRGERQK